MSEELDPVHLSAQLERTENLLITTCQRMEEGGHLAMLPDNVFDWWESFKEKQKRAAVQARIERERLAASAREKLTPEEWEALRDGD